MNGINKAIIVGRVGQDPKITDFTNGSNCAQFRVATTERGFTTRDGREVPDNTEWHNIVCYGNQAQVVQNFVRKGSSLYIEGKIRTRKFTDQSNIERYVTEIFADELQLLDKKQDDGQQNMSTASPQAAQQQNGQQAGTSSAASEMMQQEQENQEDLPF
jgi:single-strand DNA-binding protein